jgi:SAM-dependent methyltransferase
VNVLYNDDFFDEETRVALESAEVVVPALASRAWSVVVVGCGTGAWLEVAKRCGATEVLGVDGFVSIAELRVDLHEFERADLSEGYDCSGYDMAFCLEVAEHLPAEAAVPLVRGLSGAATVLFSAATPGQPGVGHINCQPHEFWHDLFADFGKLPEYVGGRFEEPVADFYRRNMFLYR